MRSDAFERERDALADPHAHRRKPVSTAFPLQSRHGADDEAGRTCPADVPARLAPPLAFTRTSSSAMPSCRFRSRLTARHIRLHSCTLRRSFARLFRAEAGRGLVQRNGGLIAQRGIDQLPLAPGRPDKGASAMLPRVPRALAARLPRGRPDSATSENNNCVRSRSRRAGGVNLRVSITKDWRREAI